jgi:hypothetical protein
VDGAVFHAPEAGVAVPAGEVFAVEKRLHSGGRWGNGARRISCENVSGEQERGHDQKFARHVVLR